MRTVLITVTGKVQGVFFRKHACRAAEAHGLTGYVMNLPDGSVQVMASGADSVISLMIDWCRSGSPGSEVSGVEVQDIPFKEFSGFTIRYH